MTGLFVSGLKDYIGELRDAAEKAVDEFLMEREYREFIQP